MPFYQSSKLTILTLMIEVWFLKVEGWSLKFERVYFYFTDSCCFLFGFQLDNGDLCFVFHFNNGDLCITSTLIKF